MKMNQNNSQDLKVWTSTKIIELGSCAFRQWRAQHSHCQYLHGYQLKAKIWCKGTHLDDKNWIVDFAAFKDIKKSLQDLFDHKVCVASDDPEMSFFEEAQKRGILQLTVLEGVGIEKTAECVFEKTNNYIQQLTNGRCWVDKVEVWEHPENSATFEIISDLIKDKHDY